MPQHPGYAIDAREIRLTDSIETKVVAEAAGEDNTCHKRSIYGDFIQGSATFETW